MKWKISICNRSGVSIKVKSQMTAGSYRKCHQMNSKREQQFLIMQISLCKSCTNLLIIWPKSTAFAFISIIDIKQLNIECLQTLLGQHGGLTLVRFVQLHVRICFRISAVWLRIKVIDKTSSKKTIVHKSFFLKTHWQRHKQKHVFQMRKRQCLMSNERIELKRNCASVWSWDSVKEISKNQIKSVSRPGN